MTALHKTKWFLPLLSVALGVLFSRSALGRAASGAPASSRSRS